MPIRDRFRQILSVKEPPRRVASAFALGIFIGMSPLLGLHTVLGVAIAWGLKLNRLVTLIGVFVTNPWTIVPIYTFGTWLGMKLLGTDHILPAIDWSNISLRALLADFKPFVLPFVVGSTLLGLVSAAAGYLLIYTALKREHE
ncbi:MAG: DUF2062 domain-containing protein [Thermodesulfovibrionales bacterium]